MHPRLFRLIETHQRIDARLRGELQRPLPDTLQLMRLKRLKLRAKDLIQRFTHQSMQLQRI
jgi:hypothetical protein